MTKLTGQVVNSSDNPVEGAVVEVSLQLQSESERSKTIRRETDVNGEFDIELHPDGDGSDQDWHITARYVDGEDFNSVSEPRKSADLNEGLTFFVRSTKDEIVSSGDLLEGHTKVRQQPNSTLVTEPNATVKTTPVSEIEW